MDGLKKISLDVLVEQTSANQDVKKRLEVAKGKMKEISIDVDIIRYQIRRYNSMPLESVCFTPSISFLKFF